jgi:two-component system OmpR family response regulator
MTKTKGQPLRKVLIIEDEGDMCLLLNIMLNGKEMELEHVKSISAAEEYLQTEQPAVVILDNKLTDGFGVDFIPVIKEKVPAAKVIMISGFDGSVKDVALENGADIFLEKPFSRDQLFQSLQGLLNQPAPVEGV